MKASLTLALKNPKLRRLAVSFVYPARTLISPVDRRNVVHPHQKLGCSDQVAELFVTIVAWIELRSLISNVLTHLAQIGPAIVARGILNSVSQKINQGCILVQIASVFLSARTARFIFAKYFCIDKLVAGTQKRFRCLFSPKP